MTIAEPAPLPAHSATLPQGRYLIAGDHADLAAILAARIWAAGGEPVTDATGPLEGLIHLAPMAVQPVALTDDPALWWAAVAAADKAAYLLVQAHAEGLRTGRMIFASALGGRFGRDGAATGLHLAGGATGLAKSLREEWPDARPKAIDLDPGMPADAYADQIMAELTAPFGRIEAGYPGGKRTIFRTVPANTDTVSAPDLPAGALILATGGARGITAESLRPFAAQGAHLVLIGRSALPGAEAPALAALADAGALRRHLASEAKLAGEAVSPALIERKLSAVLRDREIRANLSDLATAGATLDYHALDMGDPAAVRAAIRAIRATHGRVHGVIHGAGVIEDRRITDKTPESWDRVVAPKVMGALALAAALDDAPPAFFAMFASVAGRFGNSGQTDYATANELLNRIAAQLSARWPATRAVAVNWGPWAGTRHGAGMVSDGVRLKFEAQGVTLVDPDGGAAAFFDDMMQGDRATAEVTLGAGPWERHETDRADEPETVSDKALSRWPLLPVVTRAEVDRGGIAIPRHLSLSTDPWLGEHRIGGVPVLPLALAAEMAAEAVAEIWPDWQVTGLSDLRLLSGLRFDEDQGRDILIVATGAEHGDPTAYAARVELRGTGGAVARAHYRASALMIPKGAPLAQDAAALDLANDVLALRPAPSPIGARTAYRETLFHGPAYQALKALTGLDARGVTADVRPSATGSFGGTADWLFDPGLLDAAAQLAWVWSSVTRGQPALPNAIGRLTRLGHGTPASMTLRVRPDAAPPQVLADVVIADAMGVPLLLIESLESTSDAGLARFCGWAGVILDNVTDLPAGQHSGQAAE